MTKKSQLRLPEVQTPKMKPVKTRLSSHKAPENGFGNSYIAVSLAGGQ